MQAFYKAVAGAIPGGPVTLVVAILFLWFVWHSVYRHSGLVRARTFRFGLGAIAVFCLVNYAFLWVLFRPPTEPPRVLVMPFSVEREADAWIGRASAWSVETMLRRLGSDKTVICRGRYLKDLSRFYPYAGTDTVRADLHHLLGVRYLVSGSVRTKADTCDFTVNYYDLKEKRTLGLDEHRVPLPDLPSFHVLAAQKARKLFRIRAGDPSQMGDITGNMQAYRRYWQGMDHLVKEKYAAAEDDFAAALKMDTAFTYAAVQQGRAVRMTALDKKDHERKFALESSIRRIIAALRRDRNLGDGYLELAWTHIFLERYAEAENELKLANHHQPLDGRTFYLLSKLHPDRYQVFGMEREVEVLEKAVALDRGFKRARLQLIDLYLNLNRKHDARRLTETVIAMDPDNAHNRITLSLVDIYLNEWDRAIGICRDVLTADSLNADAWYNIGIAYKAQTEYDSALVYFKKAEVLGKYDALNYLAAIYEARKEYYTAIAYFRKRVKIGERDDVFRQEARRGLYRLVHKPGVVVDSNFSYQATVPDPSRDSSAVLSGTEGGIPQ